MCGSVKGTGHDVVLPLIDYVGCDHDSVNMIIY